MHDVSISISKRLRDKVWRGLCLIMGVLAGILACWNILLSQGALTLALIEIALVIYSAYLYLNVKKWSGITWQQYGYVLLLSSIVVYAVWFRPLANALYVWPLFLPILNYLALGLRQGFVISLTTLLIVLSILATKGFSESYHSIGPVLINFFFCYISIMGVSHIYERNRYRVEENLVSLALTDALTGLKNRLAFKQDFAEYMNDESPFGLMMIDIDHFKKVNDTYGHDVGDDLLHQLTQRITQSFPDADAYRQGGEEFCLLYRGDKASLVQQAERLRMLIAKEAFVVGEQSIPVTVSLGVAAINEVSEPSHLVVLADQRMYLAKRQGRNCVVSEE